MTCHGAGPHGVIIQAYRADHGGWSVDIVGCPDLDPRDQLMAAAAIADAITDNRRTLIQQIAQQN